MAKRQGNGSSGTGFGFVLAEIKELLPEKNICVARDLQTGDEYQVGLNKRGETAWPQVGDQWVLDRSMGHWLLQCKVTEESAPAFTGFFNTMDADVLRLAMVLKGLGLIRDATTLGPTPPTPPSNVYSGSQNTMRAEFIALLALLDTLGVIDDQTTAQTLPIGVWQIPTLNSPFAEYSSTYQTPRYLVDTNGFVTMSGLFKTTSAITGTNTMFTLPSGFRPPRAEVFPTLGDGNVCRQIEVQNSGNVRLANITGSVTIGFNSLTFRFAAF